MSVYSLQQVTEQLAIPLAPDVPPCFIHALNDIERAKAGEISFVVSEKYADKLAQTGASAVLVPPSLAQAARPQGCILLVCPDPYLAYAKVSQLFSQAPKLQGVHAAAVIANSAKVHATACIGAHAVIGERVQIGAHTQIGAGAVLEDDVSIGEHSCLKANVSVHYGCKIGSQVLIQANSVIGSDGFGYAPKQGGWEKIAQLGTVIIGNRVEIGANVTIDRGALQDTIIADDVIIDNQVHVAHNVEIQNATAIAGGVGIAGSTKIGKNCLIGGASGITGHIEITDGVCLAGMSMVTNHIKESGWYASGLPSMPQKEWRKAVVHLRKIESLTKRIKALEQEKKV